MRLKMMLALVVVLAAGSLAAFADQPPRTSREVRLKDISTVEGVRDNLLLGYGLVVGLNRTGDTQQTFFSTQTLGNILQRMGVQIPVSAVQVRNIAAVFVTAKLPPFARPGAKIDVTVGSIGDAKSLQGGLLLMTSLRASDGQTYAAAQGPLTIAGYSAGEHGNVTQVNHPTVARIPDGGIVERDTSVDISHMSHLAFLLRDPDFTVATQAAAAINKELGTGIARAVDGSRIEVDPGELSADTIPQLLARIGNVMVTVAPAARVVINERTGTVVLGANVSLGACSVLQGSLAVDITTRYEVSQPAPFSPNAQTTVVPETNVQAQETPAKAVKLAEGATVEDLVRGLQGIGASSRDIVAILQAIKAAGALQADLEVI